MIHNFGRADQVDHAALDRLCRSIARVVGLEIQDPKGECASARSGDVLPADVEQLRTRNYGVVLAVEALWTELGLGSTLRKAAKAEGCRAPYERALLAMVANRLDEPMSKLGVWERWLDTVHLPSAAGLTGDHFYEAMDLLHRHQATVEREVFFQTANLMNLTVDLVFYDTTTASFTIDEADDEGLRQYGRAKEADWRVQIVIALAVTRDGIPVRSWVLPGNTSDVTTIQRVKADLREWNLGRVMLVGDSGMNSEDNRATLAKACGRYVLACRPSSVNEVADDVLTRAGRYKEIRENLRVKEVIVGDGELRRRYVVCHNPVRAERERLHREEVVRELEVELAKNHPDRDARRKWVAHIRTSGRYGRYVRLDKKDQLVIDRDAIRDTERLDGKWVLVTNDDSLSPEDVAEAYLASQVIERGFRTMKSGQIEVRPMFHRLDERIEAHVKICVLALLVARVAELRAGMPWSRIRDVLAGVQVTEFATRTHRFLRSNKWTDEARDLLAKLKIEPPKQVLAITPLD